MGVEFRQSFWRFVLEITTRDRNTLALQAAVIQGVTQDCETYWQVSSTDLARARQQHIVALDPTDGPWHDNMKRLL